MAGIPPNTNAVIVDVDEYGDEIFVDCSGFTVPSRLLWGHAGESLVEVKSAPSFFDATDLEVSQHFVASADGTRIPYFVVGNPDSRPGPTLLGGYGGFENSNLPGYAGVLGRLWLARASRAGPKSPADLPAHPEGPGRRRPADEPGCRRLGEKGPGTDQDETALSA